MPQALQLTIGTFTIIRIHRDDQLRCASRICKPPTLSLPRLRWYAAECRLPHPCPWIPYNPPECSTSQPSRDDDPSSAPGVAEFNLDGQVFRWSPCSKIRIDDPFLHYA